MIKPQDVLSSYANSAWQSAKNWAGDVISSLPKLNLTNPMMPLLDFSDSSFVNDAAGGSSPSYNQLENTYNSLSEEMKALFNDMIEQGNQQFKDYTAYLDSVNDRGLAAQRQLLAEERAFQTEMSNTAWQRQFADMKAAGLNPYAAAMGGGTYAASTPQVGAGSTSFKSASYQDHVGTAIDNIVKGIDSYYNSAYRSSLADSTARRTAMDISSGIMRVLAAL